VIATLVGAGRIVRDGVNGRIVQPKDVDGLVEAFASWRRHPPSANSLGKCGAADAARNTHEGSVRRDLECCLRC
jgi:hypothetical protein